MENCENDPSYRIQLPLGRPLNKVGEASLVPSGSWGSISKRNMIHDLKIAYKEAEEAIQRQQRQHAKMIVRHTLFGLPPASDRFWKTKQPEEVMEVISLLTEILVKEQLDYKRESMSITASGAALYLKVLAISLSQAKLSGVPQEIITLYGAKIMTILKKTIPYYYIPHPHYAQLFLDALKVLKQFAPDGRAITLTPMHSHQRLFLERNAMESVSEMRKDPELLFLDDFLLTHEKIRKEVHAIYYDLVRNFQSKFLKPAEGELHLCTLPFVLDYDHSFERRGEWTSVHKPYEGPEGELIRQWRILRKLHYFALITSYLTGSVSTRSKGNVLFPHLCVSMGDLFPTDNRFEKKVALVFYQPKNWSNFSEGIFQDTFFDFSDEMKALLEDLFSRASHFLGQPRATQNEQLLFQETIALENLNLKPIEMQHLLSIQTYDELAIPQLVTFFTNYFYRLKDSRFQAIFAHFIFSLNQSEKALILQEVFESRSLVKNQLIEFLKMALDQSYKLHWHECHQFFLRTLAQVTRYLVEGPPHPSLITEACQLLDKWLQVPEENEKHHKRSMETSFIYVYRVHPISITHPPITC